MNDKDKLEVMQASLDELKKRHNEILKTLRLARVRQPGENLNTTTLMKLATENCKNETVVQWLRENSESEAFCKLVDMFHFLRKRISEEEQKQHSDSVDIVFVAHGAIRDSMIPASCLLPLPTISDVLLYSPWNCTVDADVVYGVATGLMRPQHRAFRCKTKDGCPVPGDKHRPSELPDCWNSLKTSGDQMIPNITLSPLQPPEDGVWKRFESLTKQFGQPERNRIVIPFVPRTGSGSSKGVPFFIVTLALSLVLLFSRFRATVHLAACLGDQSAGQKFDKEYLRAQYACTVDNSHMTASPDMFLTGWMDMIKRLFS